jgi:hypothetical protein
MVIRTLSRMAADPSFVFPLVELLWPGVFSSATLAVEATDDRAAVFRIKLVRTRDATTVCSLVRVVIDALHQEGHNCAAVNGVMYAPNAGVGAPVIEARFSCVSTRVGSFHNADVSTASTGIDAILRQLNSACNASAVRRCLARFINSVDRLAAALKAFHDECAARGLNRDDVGPLELFVAAERAAALPAAPPPQAAAIKLSDKLAIFVSRAFAMLHSTIPSTRAARAQLTPADLETAYATIRPIPSGLPQPKVFTAAEAEDLCAKWVRAAGRALALARPSMRRAGEDADRCVDRIAAHLRRCHVDFRCLEAQRNANPSGSSAAARLIAQGGTIMRTAAESLRAAAAAASQSLRPGVKRFQWPPSARAFLGASIDDGLPAELVAPGVGEARIARAARLLQKSRRRDEDVRRARDDAARLGGNLLYAARALEADAGVAAGVLAHPPADEAAFPRDFTLAGVFAHARAVPPPPAAAAQPLTVQPPLLANGAVAPAAAAALRHLIAHNLAAAARFRAAAACAERLAAAVRAVPTGAVPAWDRRQIYATRLVGDLLAGALAPADFAAEFVKDRGFSRPMRQAAAVAAADAADDAAGGAADDADGGAAGAAGAAAASDGASVASFETSDDDDSTGSGSDGEIVVVLASDDEIGGDDAKAGDGAGGAAGGAAAGSDASGDADATGDAAAAPAPPGAAAASAT